MKELAYALIGVIGLMIAVTWIGAGTELSIYRYFAPKQEQVRRETFEQSKAYNQGVAQELQSMQFQYEQADDAHKAALASIILHRVSDYDLDRLPPDTRVFIQQLRNHRMGR